MSGALAVTEARTEADMRDVQTLCNGFLNWLRERYSDEMWLIDRYCAPAQWQALLDSLPTVHAPPEGEILLSRLDGAPADCVMLRRLEGDKAAGSAAHSRSPQRSGLEITVGARRENAR